MHDLYQTSMSLAQILNYLPNRALVAFSLFCLKKFNNFLPDNEVDLFKRVINELDKCVRNKSLYTEEIDFLRMQSSDAGVRILEYACELVTKPKMIHISSVCCLIGIVASLGSYSLDYYINIIKNFALVYKPKNKINKNNPINTILDDLNYNKANIVDIYVLMDLLSDLSEFPSYSEQDDKYITRFISRLKTDSLEKLIIELHSNHQIELHTILTNV